MLSPRDSISSDLAVRETNRLSFLLNANQATVEKNGGVYGVDVFKQWTSGP